MTKEQEEAISTMQHWIDYEKRNKDKIQKADELINIQETVLSMLKEQQEENKKKDKIINEMARFITNKDIDEDICRYQVVEPCKNEEYGVTTDVCINCIKQYFERKVKE
jgi:hypothetical protein